MEHRNVLDANRVILAHFDSYSAALVFARFGPTLLLPSALPPGAVVTQAPQAIASEHDGSAVLDAIVQQYQLNPAEVVRMNGFDAWIATDGAPLRVHLLKFTTFLAPTEAISPHGGSFSPISSLRGAARVELELVRMGFNLILGGDAARG